MSFYLLLLKIYPQKVEYEFVDEEDDVEGRKEKQIWGSKGFVHVGKPNAPIDMER